MRLRRGELRAMTARTWNGARRTSRTLTMLLAANLPDLLSFGTPATAGARSPSSNLQCRTNDPGGGGGGTTDYVFPD
jgi:hypothetical protein